MSCRVVSCHVRVCVCGANGVQVMTIKDDCCADAAMTDAENAPPQVPTQRSRWCTWKARQEQAAPSEEAAVQGLLVDAIQQ